VTHDPDLNSTSFTTSNTRQRPAARCVRAFDESFALKQRAWGMPGARCTRSLVCKGRSTRGSHHGYTGSPGIPARNGFNGFFRALPGDRACCHRRLRIESAKLDASVEASGPHDFAVRKPMPSSEAPPASTASHPASVTIAIRPSCGTRRLRI
jgi:hypothetical protein